MAEARTHALSKEAAVVHFQFRKWQRQVDLLELVWICEELGADPRRVFADILARQQKLLRK